MRASTPVTPHTDTGGRDTAVVVQSTLQVQKPVAVVHGPSDQSRLNTAAENLDRLRSQIIEKQAEIGKLRAYYQAGINAEIQGIADKVGNAGKGKIPFESAIADPSISLGLSAIQRRDTYIKKLETPVSILVKSSEALLFFSRKAALLALMAGKTSDIDIDGFIKQTDEIRNMHGSELARLNIDAVPASPRTLASIWQDIETRMPRTAVKSDNEIRVTDTDNATIWKNICDGDFSQKHRLTKLSLEAARCLTAWKGKDLFLNALTDLSPDAARHLSAWEGDWLGLNGLTELSPEAAVHLSRWKGQGTLPERPFQPFTPGGGHPVRLAGGSDRTDQCETDGPLGKSQNPAVSFRGSETQAQRHREIDRETIDDLLPITDVCYCSGVAGIATDRSGRYESGTVACDHGGHRFAQESDGPEKDGC